MKDILVTFISKYTHFFPVLFPHGQIAQQEKQLLISAILLMMLIVVPVFTLTIAMAWRYRVSNKKAKYTPNWEHSKIQEAIWWGFPTIIIIALSFLTWTSTHTLDPYKKLESTITPLTVQVVALEASWLFIYPELEIASINELKIPEHTPINFKISADAPMNSFWIPGLGGQIYAMAGMSTQLHLIADTTGVFEGRSSNFSGPGFSQMHFKTHSLTQEDFLAWVDTVYNSEKVLTLSEYESLIKENKNLTPKQYRLGKKNLYTSIIEKYMNSSNKKMEDTDMQENMSMSQ
jgi:cytochrome o ubiquinol oxidase subunit II